MSLLTLPILPLEVIVSYLDFSSLVSLANTHPSFAYLQPKDQLVIGEDFTVSGIGWGRRGEEHHPEPYLDVKIETQGLLGVKMVWEWKGQVCRTLFTSEVRNASLMSVSYNQNLNFHETFSGSDMDGVEMKSTLANILQRPICGCSY